MIGAVFAVHPVHVESVAWITERKNVLSGLFYLLSMGCYLRLESGHGRRWGWYAGSLGLFVLALLSKTVVSTLPVALLLIRYFKGWRIGKRELLELAPFLAFGAVMGLVTKWYESHVIGASGPIWDLPIGERFLVAGRALSFYVIKLLMPINLSFHYPRWELDTADPAQWSWLVGIILAGLLFWWKRPTWGLGPVVGFAFFLVSLAPASGFFNVYFTLYSYVADHFQYLASIGIIALVVGTVSWGLDQRIAADADGKTGIPAGVKTLLGLLILTILGAMTWKQGLIYRDAETLLQDTLEKNPNSWLVHNYRGTAYLRQGRLDDAAREYLTAIKLQPRYVLGHNNLGSTYLKLGRLEDAAREYLTVLNLKPNDTDAHYNLGRIYSIQGRLEDAAREYSAILKLHPDNVAAHKNLGNVYYNQERYEEAVHEYLAVLKLEPGHILARNNLGNVYSAQGRFDEAIREYLTVLKLEPDYILAHNNLGNVYSTQGRLDEAIREYLVVLKLQPDNIVAHYNLGDAYMLKGLKEEARQQFEAALKLEPTFTPAQKGLEALEFQMKAPVGKK
jgi:tetratricopeptide (TPR) repeat protein